MKTLILALTFSLLAACAGTPLSNQIEAGSKVAQDLASQVGHLQKIGQITQAQETIYLDQLSQANGYLREADTLLVNCPKPCTSAESKLQAANDLLLKLQVETGSKK